MIFQKRITRRTAGLGLATAISGIAVARSADAQTPEASPEVGTPEASPIAFPQGPMGEQLVWLQDALNSETGVEVDEVEAHFTPEFLATTSAESVAALITEFGAAAGLYAIDTATMITTMDFPTTNASFDIVSETGEIIRGGINIDRDSGLINGFGLEWTSEATPAG